VTGEEAVSPIEGQVMLVASAKASVTASRLPGLVRRVQSVLGERVAEYERRHERVFATPPDLYFLAPGDHWATLGEELGLDEAETDAVRRAHTEQLRRAARREDREAELETALEIRDAVVIRDPDG